VLAPHNAPYLSVHQQTPLPRRRAGDIAVVDPRLLYYSELGGPGTKTKKSQAACGTLAFGGCEIALRGLSSAKDCRRLRRGEGVAKRSQ